MKLGINLAAMERSRECYWRKHTATAALKLRWRALTVRHSFHVLPGETILELGAGSGLWTKHLATVLRGESPITACVFNDLLLAEAQRDSYPGVSFVGVKDFLRDLPEASFDYVVGTSILCHDRYSENLSAIYRLLKPGGQILFFEANYWNPQVFLKCIPGLGHFSGHASCQIGLRRFQLLQIASGRGFTHIEIIPYDVVHPATPKALIRFVQNLAVLVEHAPILNRACGTLYIWARKPGGTRRQATNLASIPALYGSTSVVVPCHNEEMNIPALVDDLLAFYGPYIHEILIVDDNSRDRTAEVTLKISAREGRVKLIKRSPPNGVGRALRDGYAAASGRYILSMDSDFVNTLPEFRDLFEAIAEGYDGAFGSRFSHDSVLINYGFVKIVCNRAFHLVAKLFVSSQIRDVTNNLKLVRSDVMQAIDLRQPHFAANAETGLKPIVAGYRIKEVPVSWINRTADMGISKFQIGKVGWAYAQVLIEVLGHLSHGRSGKINLHPRDAREAAPEI